MNVTRCAARWTGVLLLTLSMGMSTTACSFFLTSGPPAQHAQMTYIPCTENITAPTTDLLMTALTILAVPVAAVYGSAAYVGYRRAAACRQARREADQAFRSLLATPEGLRPDASLVTVRLEPAGEGGASSDTLRVGGTGQLRATASNAQGATIERRQFLWTSSDSSVVRVDTQGVLEARAAGNATISARTGGVVGTRSVVVLP
jgi:hypothetical protein